MKETRRAILTSATDIKFTPAIFSEEIWVMFQGDIEDRSSPVPGACSSEPSDLAGHVEPGLQPVMLGPFTVFGGRDPGLKVQDLVADEKAIEEAQLRLVGCPVLAAEQFDRFTELTGYGPDTPVEVVLGTPELAELSSVVQRILLEIPPLTPVAVRSTARSERGGLGIYESTFLLLTGDPVEDVPAVWKALMEVYASELGGNAAAWRARTEGPLGVAVMFHPVVGAWHGDHFFPLVAGRGYTSFDGKPLLRLVAGIATEEALTAMPALSSYPGGEEFLDNVKRRQGTIWVVDRETRKLARIALSENESGDELDAALCSIDIEDLFHELESLRHSASGERYIEFAVADEVNSMTEVVQCAPVEDKKPEALSVDTTGLTEILRSDDIVNHGVCHGRGIVWLGFHGWHGHELAEMEYLNGNMEGYAVFVRQNEFSVMSNIFSTGSGGRRDSFGYRHFSNAGLVCERQFSYTENEMRMQQLAGSPVADHSKGRGGTHFSQLCDRSDILFQGGEFDKTCLPSLPGGMPGRETNVMIWDVEWVAVNDATKGEGIFYIKSKPQVQSFGSREIDHFGDICYGKGSDYFRQAEAEEASGKDNSGSRELSNAFYKVCYLLPTGVSPVDFDPFRFNEENIQDAESKEAAIKAIDLVLSTYPERQADYEGNERSFKGYLVELKKRIQAWEP